MALFAAIFIWQVRFGCLTGLPVQCPAMPDDFDVNLHTFDSKVPSAINAKDVKSENAKPIFSERNERAFKWFYQLFSHGA